MNITAHSLYSINSALAMAILEHYCQTMSKITGRPASEIRAEVMANRDQLVEDHKPESPDMQIE